MDKTKFYIAKSFDGSNIRKSEEEGSPFLGFVKMTIATTHPDRQGDIISKKFLHKIKDDLSVNTTAFYNHLTQNRSDLPIGKTVSSNIVDMKDGHQGVEIEIGISKTASDIWTLVNEGVLNKGSIGGYITDMEYDNKSDHFILKDGNTYEPSIVGIPANPEAEISSVLKTLRKSFIDQSKVNNKHTESEINMDANELSAILDSKLGDMEKKFDDRLNTEKDANSDLQKKFDLEKSTFEKEKEEMKKSLELAKIEQEKTLAENEALKKTGGRSTSKSNETDSGKYAQIYADKDYAMAKGLQNLGEFLVNAYAEDIIILEGSNGDEGVKK